MTIPPVSDYIFLTRPSWPAIGQARFICVDRNGFQRKLMRGRLSGDLFAVRAMATRRSAVEQIDLGVDRRIASSSGSMPQHEPQHGQKHKV